VAIPANRNVTQKDAKKNSKIREFMYRDTTNAKYKMFDLTEKNWSYWNNNKIKEKFETVLGKHSIDSLHNTDVLGTSHTHTHSM